MAATTRGATVLTDVYRTAPFHPGPLHDREGRAEVIVQDVSPGILPGDRLAIDVTVVEGASLSVVGQSATKLYPSPSGLPAELRTSLTVGAGGALWWLPGALIPFRDAVYTSRTHVTLHEGSRFALLEIITPGRMAMGECHAYASLDLRLRIDVAGKPVMIERTMLDPIARPPAFAADRQDLRCSGALVLIGYPVPREIENCRADVWLGADGGPNLAIVSGVSYSAEPLRNALESVLRGLQDRGD
ncbi:MAG: urease accessory protein UreD [Chloroflexia bacterium]|nr:urease accessory protein UreD [Chloroflexia bacterium]